MSPIREFNKIYFDFLLFLQTHLNDVTFKTFYRKNIVMRETNPKIFIKTWNTSVTQKYYNEISERNISFFLNKDYTTDLPDALLLYMNKFKGIYESLDEIIKTEFIDFMYELTHLSFVYYK